MYLQSIQLHSNSPAENKGELVFITEKTLHEA